MGAPLGYYRPASRGAPFHRRQRAGAPGQTQSKSPAAGPLSAWRKIARGRARERPAAASCRRVGHVKQLNFGRTCLWLFKAGKLSSKESVSPCISPRAQSKKAHHFNRTKRLHTSSLFGGPCVPTHNIWRDFAYQLLRLFCRGERDVRRSQNLCNWAGEKRQCTSPLKCSPQRTEGNAALQGRSLTRTQNCADVSGCVSVSR